MTTALTPPLSAALRDHTRAAHEHAENRGFITRLMGGEPAEADDTWVEAPPFPPSLVLMRKPPMRMAA